MGSERDRERERERERGEIVCVRVRVCVCVCVHKKKTPLSLPSKEMGWTAQRYTGGTPSRAQKGPRYRCRKSQMVRRRREGEGEGEGRKKERCPGTTYKAMYIYIYSYI